MVLPVTFRTRANYRTEYTKFEVADFETSSHAIRGHPVVVMFTVIPLLPYFVYLVLKIPTAPNLMMEVLAVSK